MTCLLVTPADFTFLLPNVITPSIGETSVFDKTATYIDTATGYLLDNLCPREVVDTLPEPLLKTMRVFIAARALRQALPALDIILTPAGFAVHDSDQMSPASAQRTEALMRSLADTENGAVNSILDRLILVDGWKQTPAAKKFVSSLFWKPDLIQVGTPLDDYFDRLPDYKLCETILGGDYFSHELMTALAYEAGVDPEDKPGRGVMAEHIRTVITGWRKSGKFPAQSVVYSLLDIIKNNPGVFPEWHNSTTCRRFVNPVYYRNRQNSGGYFF